jgi:hypothetical protein
MDAPMTRAKFLDSLRSGLSNEELNDPRRFSGMPENWSPWALVADNTYTHYLDHIVSIRAWLENQRD